MRRFHLGLLACALPALALVGLLIGCDPKMKGGKSRVSSDGKVEEKTDETKATAVVAKSYKATLKGKVEWKDFKTADDLDSSTKQLLKALKADVQHCITEAPATEKQQQTYRVGANGNVGNVFVWLAAGPGSYIQVPEEQVKDFVAKHKDVELKQPHCAFEPRCLVLFPSYRDKDGKPKETGQKLHVENNAVIPHNTKLTGTAALSQNSLDTGTLKGGSKYPRPVVLKPESGVVKIECNIHNWMRAYAWVFDHPYAAVTKATGAEDFGTYEIKNAPVGVKLRLIAWHEAEGELTNQEVTLTEGDNVINFPFRPKGT
jgi:hypothetical protein